MVWKTSDLSTESLQRISHSYPNSHRDAWPIWESQRINFFRLTHRFKCPLDHIPWSYPLNTPSTVPTHAMDSLKGAHVVGWSCFVGYIEIKESIHLKVYRWALNNVDLHPMIFFFHPQCQKEKLYWALENVFKDSQKERHVQLGYTGGAQSEWVLEMTKVRTCSTCDSSTPNGLVRTKSKFKHYSTNSWWAGWAHNLLQGIQS